MHRVLSHLRFPETRLLFNHVQRFPDIGLGLLAYIGRADYVHRLKDVYRVTEMEKTSLRLIYLEHNRLISLQFHSICCLTVKITLYHLTYYFCGPFVITENVFFLFLESSFFL